MRRSVIAFLITGLAAASLVASTPANAQPIDKGHFHDVFTNDPYDCDGIPAQDAFDVHVIVSGNERGGGIGVLCRRFAF